MKRILLTTLFAIVLAFPAMAQQYGEPTAQQPAAETQPMAETEGQLPAASSPMALIGVGGLVSLAAGYWLARRRK